MIKFKSEMIIRHCNNFDIDYIIFSILEESDQGIKVELLPFHRRLDQTYPIIESFINIRDFSNWSEVTEECRIVEKNMKFLHRNY